MSKSITQDMAYRQSLMKYAEKYGVSRASRKYNKSPSESDPGDDRTVASFARARLYTLSGKPVSRDAKAGDVSGPKTQKGLQSKAL